jgi:transcriptional activator protein UGA3
MAEPKSSRPRQRKFAPRSRTGCLTCRTRRKRCDSRGPQCANCMRLNLTCEWQPQRKLVVESSPASKSPSPELPVIDPVRSSLDFWDVLSGDLDQPSEVKHMLRYYVEAYVPSVSVAASAANYYTSLYMPWAFQINGMLDVILAISSAQLARRVVIQTVPNTSKLSLASMSIDATLSSRSGYLCQVNLYAMLIKSSLSS